MHNIWTMSYSKYKVLTYFNCFFREVDRALTLPPDTLSWPISRPHTSPSPGGVDLGFFLICWTTRGGSTGPSPSHQAPSLGLTPEPTPPPALEVLTYIGTSGPRHQLGECHIVVQLWYLKLCAHWMRKPWKNFRELLILWNFLSHMVVTCTHDSCTECQTNNDIQTWTCKLTAELVTTLQSPFAKISS